ncbi:hypothetical protein MMC27_004785 [Xylographa pallens]|nr:hypothetical protein [Xylographa pallens]
MSAEITDFVCRAAVFSLSLQRFRDDICEFLEDLAWFVRRMPAYIVLGIREVKLKTKLGYKDHTARAYKAPLMPIVSTIVSNLGKIQKPYTQTPVFNLDEVALFHKGTQSKNLLNFTFVTSDTEPRIKFVFESTLQKADWQSVFSSIHSPDACAKQCKKHELDWNEYCYRTDWQSSPVLKKVVDSITQSIQLNLAGYASKLDQTYSLIKQNRFDSTDKYCRMPSGYFPLARFRPRPRKEVDAGDTIPSVSDTVAQSYPHNWGPWTKTRSDDGESYSDASSVSSYE